MCSSCCNSRLLNCAFVPLDCLVLYGEVGKVPAIPESVRSGISSDPATQCPGLCPDLSMPLPGLCRHAAASAGGRHAGRFGGALQSHWEISDRQTTRASGELSNILIFALCIQWNFTECIKLFVDIPVDLAIPSPVLHSHSYTIKLAKYG